MRSAVGRKNLSTTLLMLMLPALFAAPASALDTGRPVLSVHAAPGAPQFADPAFSAVWQRTDAPVAAAAVKRTWFWGPQPNSPALYEEYKEGAAGKRLVQYFDKSRMEINDPNGDRAGPFFVTNGLLTIELISGRMQTGNNSFVNREPSYTNVTGDTGDPLSPSYAELAPVSSAGKEKRDPDRTGKSVTATLDKDGKVGDDPTKANVPDSAVAYYDKTTGHNIPRAMWNFLNSSGPINVNGKLVEGRILNPWFYASGLPISDAYWVRATIQGQATDVLVQAYERRVLTYVPTNPAAFRVEMGNVGQHYYDWRYSNVGPTPAPTGAAPTPTTSPAQSNSFLPRYAVDLSGDFTNPTMDKMRAIGVGAGRIYVDWAGIEPNKVSPAQYRWASYDNWFKAMSDRGLQPIGLIESCPSWACSRSGGPVRVERVGDFVEFMAALADRYGKPPYNVHVWEFWNEPDSTTTGEIKYNWGMHGDRYAAMLKAVRPAMKAADPNAKLVMGGVAYDNFLETGGPFYRKFVDDVLDASGGQFLDAFNFHYYVQNIHWCSLTGKLNELRAKLNAHGLSSLPIMLTETGYTSEASFNSSDDDQSLYVTQTYAQTAGEGLVSTTWFLAKDFAPTNPGQNIFRKSGLLDEAGTPKPAASAYKTATEQIGQRPPVRALGANDGLTGMMRGYELGADAAHNGKLWVLWAWDFTVATGPCGARPAPRDFSIPAPLASKVKGVLNIYGQPVRTYTGANGSLVFSLDEHPVYIQY